MYVQVTMYCSSDILKMKSTFFGAILIEQEQNVLITATKSKASNAMWREPIVLADNFPYEAAALLENIHENYLLAAPAWNSTFCRLRRALLYVSIQYCVLAHLHVYICSVVWCLDEFIDNFAQLIDAHFEAMLHYVKASNWRTNACLLEGMDIVVFSCDLGDEPVLLTG